MRVVESDSGRSMQAACMDSVVMVADSASGDPVHGMCRAVRPVVQVPAVVMPAVQVPTVVMPAVVMPAAVMPAVVMPARRSQCFRLWLHEGSHVGDLDFPRTRIVKCEPGG
jgi:hypothetical protein